AGGAENRGFGASPPPPPGRATQTRDERRDTACRGADVQAAHAGADPRRFEQASGDRSVDLMLKDEPPRFGLASAEDVGVDGVHGDVQFVTNRPERTPSSR